jgi:hypothetical protein
MRMDHLPSPALPLAYFGGAHIALSLACAALVLWPDLPGPSHYHPRMIALLHLVTVGWITGSILGAFYIVAPLALGTPMRAGRWDAAACVAFWAGAAALVPGFWTGRFTLVGAGSMPVLAVALFVGVRVIAGMRRSTVPRGVAVHIVLAFANVLLAGVLGLALAVNRMTWQLPVPPLSLALAHGHLAVTGWVLMTVFGVAYRLVPMVVPAAMPTGRRLATSAVLLEIGALGLATSIVAGWATLPWALAVVGACAAFFVQLRAMLRHRRPRPVELPRPDWSTSQTYVALLYLFVAVTFGMWLALGWPPAWAAWIYGGAGILGFPAQMVVGIQGRLVPMHAWYRSMAHRDGAPPAISAHRLIEPRLARAVLIGWGIGVPLLLVGMAARHHAAIASGAAALLVATVLNAAHGLVMARRAAAAPDNVVDRRS